MMTKSYGKLNILLRFALSPVVMTMVTFLLLITVQGLAAEPKNLVFENVSSSAAPAAIPLAEVALQSTEISDFLRTSVGTAASRFEIESIRQALPSFSSEIATQYRETSVILEGYSTLSGLQSQQKLWQQKQLRAQGWLTVLTTRAKKLDTILGFLAVREKSWVLTLEVGRASDASESILQQIETTLTTIAAARTPLQQQRSILLDLQISLARDLTVCGNALQAIARAQQSVVMGTFQPDSPPIWRSFQWGRTREALSAYSGAFFNTIIIELDQYSSDSRLIPSVLLCAAVFLLIFFARQRYRKWETTGTVRTFSSDVFEHPWCASLTVILLALTSPYSEVPAHTRAFLQAVSVVPMILLVRSSVDARVFFWLCTLGILFAVDAVRQAFSGVMSVGQVILVFESIAAIAVIGWRMTRKGPIGSLLIKTSALRVELFRPILYVLLACFAVSLVAAVTGYMNLARLLAPSILVGGYLGLGLYASVRMVSGMIAFFLHLWPFKQLRMVQQCRDLLEKRLYLLLIWAAIVGWVFRFLYYMGLLEPVTSIGKHILAAKYERGSIALSVGDVVVFPLAVWIAYLISALLRFVLKEEVFPRMHVAPGKSYATSSLLHYLVLVLGFFFGIGLMGIDLTRVTVLAGALGVGIGFGLQSVVNNFVSGLILLFERPVSPGDSIEVGELMGEMRRIGMRSSTVRTWKGADIIVPNSQLITEKVTNWTLSDRRRRIDLPVGVNYGADPKKVICLLEELARAHPGILKNPAPQCLFLGYGDSSINFELRAWTDKFYEWTLIRSDLAVAVYDAVSCEADLSFPFPQRDVHLVFDSGIDTAAGSGVANDDTEDLKERRNHSIEE